MRFRFAQGNRAMSTGAERIQTTDSAGKFFNATNICSELNRPIASVITSNFRAYLSHRPRLPRWISSRTMHRCSPIPNGYSRCLFPSQWTITCRIRHRNASSAIAPCAYANLISAELNLNQVDIFSNPIRSRSHSIIYYHACSNKI